MQNRIEFARTIFTLSTPIMTKYYGAKYINYPLEPNHTHTFIPRVINTFPPIPRVYLPHKSSRNPERLPRGLKRLNAAPARYGCGSLTLRQRRRRRSCAGSAIEIFYSIKPASPAAAAAAYLYRGGALARPCVQPRREISELDSGDTEAPTSLHRAPRQCAWRRARHASRARAAVFSRKRAEKVRCFSFSFVFFLLYRHWQQRGKRFVEGKALPGCRDLIGAGLLWWRVSVDRG